MLLASTYASAKKFNDQNQDDIMKKNYLVYLLLFITVFICNSSFARSKELIDPAPITFSQPIEIEKVEGAIFAAMINEDWRQNAPTVTESNGKSIDVIYSVRAHKIFAKIVFDPNGVKLLYVDSINLNYTQKKNKMFIHPSYMVWTQQLMDSIDRNIKTGKTDTLQQSNVPTEALKNFHSFKLHTVTLSERYQNNEGNLASTTNLDVNLAANLVPVLNSWKKEGNRHLDVKVNVEGIRFIGTAARIMVGAMAGRSWVVVKIEFVEHSTNKTIGTARLYRIADKARGYTAARNDYAMIEGMADDIVKFIKVNYEAPVGSGTPVPANIESEL